MIEPNRLRNLRIGSLPLGFDPDKIEYTVSTTNASNTISATCDYPVTITVNGVEQENSKSVTWNSGENTVIVTVQDGLVYTVTVTKE